MASLFFLPKVVSLPGSKLYFYRTGTATAQDVFTDEDLTTAHSQPVIADASGVFAPIYLAQTDYNYRVTHNTSADVLIYQVDDIPNNLGNGRSVTLESTSPFVFLNDTDGGADEKKAKIAQQGGDLTISVLNDAESVETTAIKVFRTGTTVDDIRMLGTTLTDATGQIYYPAITGSFTGTLTGYASGPTGTVNYKVIGNIVTLWITSDITGTSNATSLTMTGLPTAVRPGSIRSCPCIVEDNTQDVMAGLAIIETAGSITFRIARQDSVANLIQYSASGFTNSGTKGLTSTWMVQYVKTS